MGKISILSQEQKEILDLITKNDFFSSNFYFTGGTVLSECYLHHRYSEDLDFFSEKKFDQQVIITYMSELGKKLNFTFNSRFVEVVYKFNVFFKSGNSFKIDFAYYPYKRLDRGEKYNFMEVDSLKDIATNKFLTINQRTDIKDYVDLYFLLQNKFNIWDLLYAAQNKFKEMEFDILLIAQDLLKIENFTQLPRMINSLTIDELKIFFRLQAKNLGLKVVSG